MARFTKITTAKHKIEKGKGFFVNFLEWLSTSSEWFFKKFEGVLKKVFSNKAGVFVAFFLILCLALIIYYSARDDIDSEKRRNWISGLITMIGSLLWWFIYQQFDGFDFVLNDESFLDMGKSRKILWSFEILTFIIPIGLMWYRWVYSRESIFKNENDQSIRREKLLEQMAREDAVAVGIPVILFGVGMIYESQKFTLNRYLLGGAFFGSVIPFLIDVVITDSEDTDRLFYIQHIKFIFIIIGVTMILMSLFKYFHFKKTKKKKEVEDRKLGITTLAGKRMELVNRGIKSNAYSDDEEMPPILDDDDGKNHQEEYMRIGKNISRVVKNDVAKHVITLLKHNLCIPSQAELLLSSPENSQYPPASVPSSASDNDDDEEGKELLSDDAPKGREESLFDDDDDNLKQLREELEKADPKNQKGEDIEFDMDNISIGTGNATDL